MLTVRRHHTSEGECYKNTGLFFLCGYQPLSAGVYLQHCLNNLSTLSHTFLTPLHFSSLLFSIYMLNLLELCLRSKEGESVGAKSIPLHHTFALMLALGLSVWVSVCVCTSPIETKASCFGILIYWLSFQSPLLFASTKRVQRVSIKIEMRPS